MIPKTVQRQLDAATALEQQLAGAQATAAEAPAQPATPTPPQATEQPSAAPAPSVDWEAKFRTVDGMFKAEVPALKARNKVLEGQVVALTEQVAALSKAVESNKPPAQPEKPQVDPNDVKVFGDDMMEMIGRYLAQTKASLEKQLDDRLSRLEQQLTGVTQKTVLTQEQLFYRSLDSEVPEWRQINDSQEWLEWLAVVDPVYGVPRQVALDAAHERLDAPRTIAVFKQFVASRPPRPTLEGQQTPTGAPAPVPPPPPPAPSKSVITSKFIDQFYRDQARGKYAANPVEEQRIEAEINAAVMEGRVVQV